MSPEAKTLVQRNVKKDPKKPPPFCKQYQSASRYSFLHDHDSGKQSVVPQFLIKGVVFNQKSEDNTSRTETPSQSNPNDVQHFTSSTDSGTVTPAESDNESYSISDNLSVDGYHNNCVNAPKNFVLNLDQYGMDKHGYLPGMAHAPLPISTNCLSAAQITHAPPSPSTRQIIRVDVTVNREKAETDKIKQVVSAGFAGRSALVRDKKGRFKFNSNYI